MADVSAAKRFGYSEKVIEHFKNPKNIGKMDDADVNAKVGSVACGDLIKLYVKIDEPTNTIKDITFESYGCAANIATSSMMTELVKGKTIQEARNLTFKEIAQELGGLPKIKMHCAVLSRHSLEAALLKYEANRGRIPIDEVLVRKILMGVLDPVEGKDIIDAKMVDKIVAEKGKIVIVLGLPQGEVATTIKEDIFEAFEGLDVVLEVILRGQSEPGAGADQS